MLLVARFGDVPAHRLGHPTQISTCTFGDLEPPTHSSSDLLRAIRQFNLYHYIYIHPSRSEHDIFDQLSR
jgi:hypothetical protein